MQLRNDAEGKLQVSGRCLILCIEHSIFSLRTSKKVRGVQHYVIKFVSDLRQVGGFFPGTPVSSANKTDRHHITEILLKVVLNTIKQTNVFYISNM